METENNDGAEKRGGSCGCSALLAAFDDALNENPFLWFEIGYTRPTDWMVHIWDKRGGTEKKIVCTQDTDRDAACELAAEKLKRHMGKKPWDFAANSKVSYHADNAGGAHGKDTNDK
jgi:hypothetical protein